MVRCSLRWRRPPGLPVLQKESGGGGSTFHIQDTRLHKDVMPHLFDAPRMNL